MEGNTPLICDFGFACVVTNTTGISHSEVGCGNVMHISPENQELRESRMSNRIPNFSKEERMDIQRKEDVYSFGVLIAEILVGSDAMEYMMTDYFRGESFNYPKLKDKICDQLKTDSRIYGIVHDCLKNCSERPTIETIYARLKEWRDHTTASHHQVRYRIV